MNKQIDELEKNLLNIINNCGLPVGVVYFVVKDILNELQKMYSQAVINENKPENQSSAEEETENEQSGINTTESDLQHTVNG